MLVTDPERLSVESSNRCARPLPCWTLIASGISTTHTQQVQPPESSSKQQPPPPWGPIAHGAATRTPSRTWCRTTRRARSRQCSTSHYGQSVSLWWSAVLYVGSESTYHQHRQRRQTGKPRPSGSRASSSPRRTRGRGASGATSLGTWRRSARRTGACCFCLYLYICTAPQGRVFCWTYVYIHRTSTRALCGCWASCF